MIAIVKYSQWDARADRLVTWWEPMAFAWQREAERAEIPRCAHRCRCGLRLRAMTPDSLSTLIAAHRDKCQSS